MFAEYTDDHRIVDAKFFIDDTRGALSVNVRVALQHCFMLDYFAVKHEADRVRVN